MTINGQAKPPGDETAGRIKWAKDSRPESQSQRSNQPGSPESPEVGVMKSLQVSFNRPESTARVQQPGSTLSSTPSTARSGAKEATMFSLESTISKLSTPAFTLLVRRIALSLLVLAVSFCLLGGVTPRAEAQQGRLSIQQLGDALTVYGKNTVNDNGHTYYMVNCGNGNWKSSVTISLSPNGNFIWMTIDPVELPSHVSAPALANLLKKNVEFGPMFFSINGNRIRLSYPIPNNGMDQGKVKAYLEAVVNGAVDTMPLWSPKTLEGQ
jgi:hypothetical protein